MELSEKKCVPCQGGLPALNRDEAERYIARVPRWQLAADGNSISCTWKWRNFAEALAFVNRVGEVCEAEGHHPDIRFGWGYATVVFYTHKIGGLHENDFIMAAKLDLLTPD